MVYHEVMINHKTRHLPVESVVFWDAPESRTRLREAEFCNDFYVLSPLFERQQKPTYCGVASAVMVLNALRLPKKGLLLEEGLDVTIPASHGGGKMRYNAYSQLTFFEHLPENLKDRERVEGTCPTGEFDPGFCLQKLAGQLRAHLTKVEIKAAAVQDEKNITRFRHNVMAYLNDTIHYMITNFHGKTLGLSTGGHFSPIAAYHQASDSVLVLDVCSHKYPWFWVPLPLLYHAMHTQDGDGWRGYLVVSDKL